MTGFDIEVDGRTYHTGVSMAGTGALIIDGLEHSTAYPITIRATSALGPGAPTTVIGHTASPPESVERLELQPRGNDLTVLWGLDSYYYPAPVTS